MKTAARIGLIIVAAWLHGTHTAFVFAADPGADSADKSLRDKTLASARAAYEFMEVGHRAGTRNAEDVYRWSVRWMDAERATQSDPEQIVKSVEAHLKRMEALDKANREIQETSTGGLYESVDATRFYVLEASQILQEAKAKVGKGK